MFDIVIHLKGSSYSKGVNNELNWEFRDNGIGEVHGHFLGWCRWVVDFDWCGFAKWSMVKGVGSCKPIVVPGFNGDV